MTKGIAWIGFGCSVAVFLGFGGYAVWCADHGFNICQSTGDWFNEECIEYTFDRANAALDRTFMSIPVMMAFLFLLLWSKRDDFS